MPARAPASMLMLQTVIRPAMSSAADRLAGIFDHVPGAARGADLADDRQHDVLRRARPAPACRPPRTSMFFAGFCSSVCVASTCSTSDVPMPNASAPIAPCVRGVAVAADDGHARQADALLRPDDVDDALPRVAAPGNRARRTRRRCAPASRPGCRLSCSAMPALRSRGRDVVVHHRDRRVRPAHLRARPARSPSNACGLVTSCTRWRSM